MTRSYCFLCFIGTVLFLSVVQSRAGAPEDDELRCDQPLLAAAAKNDVAKLKALLSQGTKANEGTNEGFTALICSSDAGATDAVHFLLENGANPNSCTSQQNLCPLWYAAMGNHADAVSLLIEHGAKREEMIGWNGNTTLAWAVRTGKEKAVRVLVEKGAALDPVTKKEYYGGKTALQWAKIEKRQAVVEIIEKAANKRIEQSR